MFCLKFMVSLVLVIALGAAHAEQKILPWQQLVERPSPGTTKSLEHLFQLPWRNSGGEEGRLSISSEKGPWGGKHFKFSVKIDHYNAVTYPIGWPSFEVQPKPPLDFSGYDGFAYWIRCHTKLNRLMMVRFILWTNGANRIQELIPPFRPGKWIQVVHRIGHVPHIDKVDRIHFFVCESEYAHGDEMTFEIGGFQLCKIIREPTRLGRGEAAMGLWVGKRADTSDEVVILQPNENQLPALLVFEAGEGIMLQPSDEVRVRFHEVFSGKRTWRSMRLGEGVSPSSIKRISMKFDTSGLRPGYYLVVADVQRGGRSLLQGRLGSDDFYIRKPSESMTYTVLSVRTGMALWIRDQLYGGIIGRARVALPHVYDPFNKETYYDFIKLYAKATWKHTEGNEAGNTSLALAAEAFRKTGDMRRCKFAEWLLEDSIKHMVTHMQAPDGGVRTTTDELMMGGYAKSWADRGWTYDSNQIGEWMRAITYAIIYFSRIPEKRGRARELSAVVRKSAEFLVSHSTQYSNGIPNVIRHLILVMRPDGSVEQRTYYQEGRQCDVYLGRALSGLSYYAYAMQLLGEEVPQRWWKVMDNTVKWCEWKMKPNGWFDWQCEDVVEGGCHTFLGNIYVGEGLFGVYLASKIAGREESAQNALRATHKAYRYVTDDCWIKGRKFGPPTEFWVGPYLYWLFTEYLDTVGAEPRFEEWLRAIDHEWTVERKWKDFLDRPQQGAGYVYRAAENGMLNLAVLGYLGIKHMSEIGKPLHWTLSPPGKHD